MKCLILAGGFGTRLYLLTVTKAKPSSSLIATAIYILPPRLFPLLSRYCSEGKRDNLGAFIAYLVDKDEVHAYPFTEPWLDIGSKIEVT